MADGSTGTSVVRHLVDTAWSARDAALADPDDPLVRGFAEFGLPSYSPLATEDQLRDLETWRQSLRISANSAFLDGTLLDTVFSLLGYGGQNVLTPVTLWELTAFIDALVCFDRLYCVANPIANMFNRQLGADVLTAIPDPDGGMLRRLATQGAISGLSEMRDLRMHAGQDDAFGQEVQAVVDGWRAVLGSDFPSDGPFDPQGIDIRFIEYGPDSASSAYLLDGYSGTTDPSEGSLLELLVLMTRLPRTPADSIGSPLLRLRQLLAATATYRTYVNQRIANALGLPYLPGTLRMPFRRLFVERAAEVQDELIVSIRKSCEMACW